MSPEYFDVLGDQLVAASQREHRRHTARPLRWQKMARRPLFIAIAALVLAASALAVTQPWAPQELTATANSDPPALSGAPVPSAQSAAFAVLRRPQSAADRGAVTRAALKYVHAGGTVGVKSNDIRLLNPGAVDQPPVVLVPVAAGENVAGGGVDELCLVALEPTAGNGAGKTCIDSEHLRTQRLDATLGPFAYGVVPDEVAAVRVAFQGAEPIVVPVHNNFYGFTVPQGARPVSRIAWLDADGHPVP